MKTTNFFRVLAIAVVALCGLAACEKDPVVESANIELYAERLEAQPEGEEPLYIKSYPPYPPYPPYQALSAMMQKAALETIDK